MTRVTGERPRLWSSVIGFGQYHYKYASGREGDAHAVGLHRVEPPRQSICPTASGDTTSGSRSWGCTEPAWDAYTSPISTRSTSLCWSPSSPSRTALSPLTRTHVGLAKVRLDTLGIASGRFLITSADCPSERASCTTISKRREVFPDAKRVQTRA